MHHQGDGRLSRFMQNKANVIINTEASGENIETATSAIWFD
jgi:hypothetical protein